jgi:sulfur-oxidizing protein SoxX
MSRLGMLNLQARTVAAVRRSCRQMEPVLAAVVLAACAQPAAVSRGEAQGASASPPSANAVQALAAQGGSIDEPLTAAPGDAARGRAIVASRQQGLCLLCHTGPFPEERFQGNLAPDLGGAGKRWSVGQLRLRVVDAQRLNPSTIMPPYHRTEGLNRVGSAWQSRPLLSAQQIEDVVAFLATLRD